MEAYLSEAELPGALLASALQLGAVALVIATFPWSFFALFGLGVCTHIRNRRKAAKS